MSLSSKQRAFLRSAAHHLKPILHVGKEGVTDATIQSLEEALNTHELFKVKVQEASPVSARDAGGLFTGRIPGLEHVQTIGRTVILYRPHAETPEIRLPK